MKELNEKIYPMIFKRKSTRSYSNSPVPTETVDLLTIFMQELVPLSVAEKAAFEVQPHKGNIMKIAAYAKNEKASLINLAFMLQQIDLFLQSQGLGAVWNATVRATKKEYEGLPYRISLIFGIAKQSTVRENIQEFDRMKLQEIANNPNISAVKAVHVAPSARNKQPWYLNCKDGRIDFYCKKGGFIQNMLLHNLHWLDIGIAVCHAVLALQYEAYTPNAEVQSQAPEKEGYEYAISLNY